MRAADFVRLTLGLIFASGVSSGLSRLPEAQAAQQPGTRIELSCQAETFLGFYAVLDPTQFEEGSGYAFVLRASLQDGFSGAQLICSDLNEPGEFNCIGYWNGGYDQKVATVEIRHRSSDGKQVARFTGYYFGAQEALCESKTIAPF